MQLLRHFSYSDRIRYYWTDDDVKFALKKLFANLSDEKIPETMVSQYFPDREFGSLDVAVDQLASDHIAKCIGRYYEACGTKV